MPNQYKVGQPVRLSAAFTNRETGDPADPGALTMTIEPPAGDATEYVYGTDAELVKASVGNYYVDWTVAAEGIHWYNAVGTGANAAVAEAWFWGDEVRTE